MIKYSWGNTLGEWLEGMEMFWLVEVEGAVYIKYSVLFNQEKDNTQGHQDEW